MTSNLTHILYINVTAEIPIDGESTKKGFSYDQNSVQDQAGSQHKEKNTSNVARNEVEEAMNAKALPNSFSFQKEKVCSFRCPLCRYRTYSREFARLHLEGHLKFKRKKSRVSESENYTQSQKMFYSCHICEFKTCQKDLLGVHMLTHSDTRFFRCSQCSFKGKNPPELIKHYEVHVGKINRCTKCDYQTQYEGDFQQHMLVHSGTKLFKCLLCTYESNVERNVIRHQVVHSDSKLHQCPHCSFKTNYKDYLRKHFLQHMDKWYSCPECYFETNDKDSFRKHLKTHC